MMQIATVHPALGFVIIYLEPPVSETLAVCMQGASVCLYYPQIDILFLRLWLLMLLKVCCGNLSPSRETHIPWSFLFRVSGSSLRSPSPSVFPQIPATESHSHGKAEH